MKQRISSAFLVLLFSVLLLSSLSAIPARLLAPKQDDKEVKANVTAHAWSSTEMRDDTELMGSEWCNEKDEEECYSRRLIAEAHLDYIYTQQHKP